MNGKSPRPSTSGLPEVGSRARASERRANRGVAGGSLQRRRLRCNEQRVAGIYKRGARIRFTRERHDLLGKLVAALPGIDLRQRDLLRFGIRLGAELVGAYGCKRRY